VHPARLTAQVIDTYSTAEVQLIAPVEPVNPSPPPVNPTPLPVLPSTGLTASPPNIAVIRLLFVMTGHCCNFGADVTACGNRN